MVSIMFPSFVQVLVGSALFFVSYYVYRELTLGASRRALIKKHGCRPVKDTAELNRFPNTILGIYQLQQNLAAHRAGRFLDSIRERFRRNGNTFHAKSMLTDICSTIEPENVKTILALNFKDWELGERRKTAFTPLLGHGIFTTDGVAWQRSRELLRPNFTRSQVGDLATFETHVDHMIKAIPHDRSTINLQDLFFQMTMDSAAEFLFGESTGCLASGKNSERNLKFAEAVNRSMRVISERLISGKLGQWSNRSNFKRDSKCIHDFVDHFVKKSLEYRKIVDLSKGSPEPKEGERYVFLNELAKRTADPVQIRSELLNILLAGRDTTASLLSDVWFILARRPDIWAKLRAEVDELGGEQPTYQQVKDMKYLRMVLNESLRLYPVVPSNLRQAVVDTVLPLGGGEDGKSPLFVPKGQLVQWSPYTMHRRKDYYGEDAEEFKPERWETLRPGWEYLPFGGGPRICIGQQFALTEASYTTIRLMQEFKSIESRDPRPWREKVMITCAIDQGTIVGLTPA